MNEVVTNKQIWLARGVALLADALQVGVFPLFAAGGLSPVNAALDVAVAAILTKLVGWHIAFVPSFVVEMLPMVDLAPSWTLAVFIATRGRAAQPATVTVNGVQHVQVRRVQD